MSSVMNDCRLESPPERGGPVDNGVRSKVWGVLAAIFPRGGIRERRSEHRYPYPYLVYLTPIDKDGLPEGESVVVVGKHLSEHGLGFYHPKPLPYRRMIATLEAADGEPASFLIDLAWCRFTRHGWYESGGRFLEVVECPLVLED
jgi:hypothetical protein